ncbi:MAG: cation:proton antiporter, partial [Candidatus Thermoplasmatota archaeon]|nr:cation:proton antiporter [Candidatus Thermoplasmatota archaeon]
RGEVGLIVAAIGLSSGAVDAGEYAIVLFVVVVTTLLAPLLLRPMIQNLESSRGLDEPPPMATPDAPDEPA